MKKILSILLLLIGMKGYSQDYKKYTDSSIKAFSKTLDSVVVNNVKGTSTNNTIILDTVNIAVNTAATYLISVETDGDNIFKLLYIRNIKGVYSIINDDNVKDFSYNKKRSFFSTTILYNINASIINNRIIISATGMSGTPMTWKLSKTLFP